MNGGLNPYKYKFKRSVRKFSETPKGKKAGEIIEKSAPWWGTLMGTFIGISFATVGAYIDTISNILMSIIGWGFIIAGAFIFAVSITYGIYYWGLGLLYICYIVLKNVVDYSTPYAKKIYRFAFPK